MRHNPAVESDIHESDNGSAANIVIYTNGETNAHGKIVPTRAVLEIWNNENMPDMLETAERQLTRVCDKHRVVECFTQYHAELVSGGRVRFVFV